MIDEQTGQEMVEVSSDDFLRGAIMALDPSSPMPEEWRQAVLQEYERIYGEGAVEELAANLNDGGGEISDGQSDSIEAEVVGPNGSEPARLSEGEYVIPADVVSSLGNGSSEAGVKQLNQMIDRIRTETTGTPEQPPAIDAGKALGTSGGIG